MLLAAGEAAGVEEWAAVQRLHQFLRDVVPGATVALTW
jgi:hypothetical protein